MIAVHHHCENSTADREVYGHVQMKESDDTSLVYVCVCVCFVASMPPHSTAIPESHLPGRQRNGLL